MADSLMGRKSSAKPQGSPVPPGPTEKSSSRITALIVVVVVALAAVIYVRQGSSGETTATASASASAAPTAQAVATVPPQQQKAHTQDDLPPINVPGYAPRPADVIRTAYVFAAEHPEVLSYVPCFCGCSEGGHKGNHDCFVRERAANGDVIAWDDHGVECTMCIDIANRSKQMFDKGTPVAQIRESIEKEFGSGLESSKTPTPLPPK